MPRRRVLRPGLVLTMTYPFVGDLAAEARPVRVTCGVLGHFTQAFHTWVSQPDSRRDLDDAYLTNAVIDAHCADPSSTTGCCRTSSPGSGRPWGSGGLGGCPLSRSCGRRPCARAESAAARRPGQSSTMTMRSATSPPGGRTRCGLPTPAEHPTSEGKLYCCLIEDVFGNRLVGYPVDERMTGQLAVGALRSAVAGRGPTSVVMVQYDRGSQF